jgi:hypothetical protein
MDFSGVIKQVGEGVSHSDLKTEINFRIEKVLDIE